MIYINLIPTLFILDINGNLETTEIRLYRVFALRKHALTRPITQRLRWSRCSVLAFGTQLDRFKPDRSRWIFQDEKKNP